jgi:hypothetical protein
MKAIEITKDLPIWLGNSTIKEQIFCNHFDDLVKSLKTRISVIPAKAGIQLFQILKNSLDSGFHRSDDFLRFHENSFSAFICVDLRPMN